MTVPTTPKPAAPKPRPIPTPTSQPFWDALRQERIVVQRCDECRGWVHYPRTRCPHCLSDQLSWHELDGNGTVYTFSVARQPTMAPFLDETPQVIAVVELVNGPRVTTTVVGIDADDVTVGLPVRAHFDHGDDGITLLRFVPR